MNPNPNQLDLDPILYRLPSRFSGMAVPAQEGYAVYSTYDKVVGLARLPFDGNPSQVHIYRRFIYKRDTTTHAQGTDPRVALRA